MRIVLDTNVLVSGLHNPNGAPGRIVDLILAGRIRVLFDDRILTEYLEVLSRPQPGIERSAANAFIGYIRLAGEGIIAPPLPKNLLPDPDDLPFAELAIAAQAEALVTGNAKHFLPLKETAVTVLSPAECLERFLPTK
jgi:putative PIN family toxin of toxin-antitoxin system